MIVNGVNIQFQFSKTFRDDNQTEGRYRIGFKTLCLHFELFKVCSYIYLNIYPENNDKILQIVYKSLK